MNIPYSRQLGIMHQQMNARNDDRTKKEEIKKKKDQKIKADDKKYNVLVQALITELLKRNIDISDENFNEKLDEIILSSFSKFPYIKKMYSYSNVTDIRNAVKRAINKDKILEFEDK